MQSQICKHRIAGANQNAANHIKQKRSQYSNTTQKRSIQPRIQQTHGKAEK